MPVKMKIPFVKGCVFHVHVVITGQSKNLGFLLRWKNIFQNFIFLLENPSGADGVLLISCSVFLYLSSNVRHLEQFIHKVLDSHGFFIPSDAQGVKVGLKLMIVNGCIHIVKRYINKITGNNINIGHCLGQEQPHALKSPMNISHINNFHK